MKGEVLKLLETISVDMNKASKMMIKVGGEPWESRAKELKGASGHIKNWIAGIKKEIKEGVDGCSELHIS